MGKVECGYEVMCLVGWESRWESIWEEEESRKDGKRG